MTTQLAPSTFYRDFDNQGNPLAFGSVYTYIAGTSMLTATYVDSTQTTQNTNPIILNARGEAQIWLVPGNTYKFAVFDQYGNQIRIVDQIYSLQGLNALTQSTIGALLYPSVNGSVTTYDTTQTQALIGQAYYATDLWLATGSAGSRLQEFAFAFEYNATGGGTYANDADFGVALYAAAQLTGGSRAVYAFNAVTVVTNTAGSGGTAGQLQAAAMGIEVDMVNLSSTNANLNSPPYAYTAPDQMIGIRVGSTDGATAAKHPQYAFSSFSSSAANRWQAGMLLVNWQQYGLQIVQDPTNQPGTGAAVTGPCIQLWASSSGGNPIFQIANVSGTEVFSITQAGEIINANNVPIQFRDSATSPQNAINVDGSNILHLSCSPTGPGKGYLEDQSANVKLSWNATGLGFFTSTPVAKPTVTGSKGANAALGSLMTALSGLGLVTDSTT